jgi:DNA-binding GntR family transcriptional regulator
MSPRLEQALPKYVQIANHIRGRIVRGELRPGDEVPSERQIVEDFGVARPTATRALNTLRMWGLVEARPGTGTFVRAKPQLARRARDRYAQARATGRAYTSGERSEIIAAELAPATEEVAAALGIEVGQMAVQRQRIIHDQGGPVEVATSWFSAQVAEQAPHLLEPSRIQQGTLAYVEEATGRRGRVARDRETARLATPEEARALQLGDRPAAVLLIHHTTYDDGGEPIEFVEAVYPGGRWTFEDEYPIG